MEKSTRKRGDKKVVVFEEGKYAEVQHDVEYVDGFGQRLPPVFFYQEATAPTAEGGEGDEQQETPIPEAIEKVGGGHDEEVLRFQVPVENEPVEQEHNG